MCARLANRGARPLTPSLSPRERGNQSARRDFLHSFVGDRATWSVPSEFLLPLLGERVGVRGFRLRQHGDAA